MFPLNTIIAWSINIIMNKKYDNNNIIIASRAYFLQKLPLRHHKSWEDLHNLIGGPQEIVTEAPQRLGISPQLNWRSPRNPLSH
jgi:hypothetical protein